MFTITGEMGPNPERRRVALEIETTVTPSVIIPTGHVTLEITGKFTAH